MVVPRHARHCNDCDVCIEHYDHHCPWTSKCIGGGNLIQFYIFLAWTPIYLIYITVAFVACMSANLVKIQQIPKTIWSCMIRWYYTFAKIKLDEHHTSRLDHLHLYAQSRGEFQRLDNLVPNTGQEDLLLAGEDLYLLISCVFELSLQLKAHLRELSKYKHWFTLRIGLWRIFCCYQLSYQKRCKRNPPDGRTIWRKATWIHYCICFFCDSWHVWERLAWATAGIWTFPQLRE